MATATRLTAAEIDGRTPPTRNRYADLLRVLAIVVVVYGHWLVAVITVRDGQMHGANLLGVVPQTQWLTWIFQVMPLFFWVGGYANAVAYRSALERGIGWAEWVRGRSRRLLRPVLPLVVLWVPVGAALGWLGVPRDMVRFATQIVFMPVWFLAAYLVIVALVPLTYPLHRRFGWGALAGLVLLAAAVDAAHLAGVPLIGWTNFLWVWGAVHQAGYLWHEGVLPSRPGSALVLAAAGFGLLVLLTTVGGYPLSMVGIDGATRTNNSPPTVALLALAAGQSGLALALRRPAERWLRRPRVWASVVVVGARIMTVYLWHQTVMVGVAAVLYPTGIWPVTETVDTRWWLQRPLWLAILTAGLLGAVLGFGRFEHAGAPRPRASRIRAGVGLVAATAGLGLLVFGGLHRPGTATGVPWLELGLLAVGLGALGVLRRPKRSPKLPAPGGAAEASETAPPESHPESRAEPHAAPASSPHTGD